jgi:4-aminobutyrate aminotransferase
VLIADEVQTGYGRTGKMFAMEHFGVLPDLMTMAKSMGGGTTLSAVSGRTAIMDAPNPGGLGGTYAGNPLSVAAAHAVMDVMVEENLCERARILGERLHTRLLAAKAKNTCIGDVRALGAMVACDLVHGETGAPDADLAKKVQQAALQQGLILLTCGVYGNVLRFLFPLTIEDSVFNEALGILDQVLA